MVQTDFAPQEINIQEIDAQEVQKVNEICSSIYSQLAKRRR